MLKTRKRIAVLGSGPAGMFAAYAALRAGYEVDLVTQRQTPSTMFGAQYLHAPIPGLTGESFVINYQLQGTIEDYALKVYGDPARADETSPAKLLGEHHAWDIRAAYREAWEYAAPAVNWIIRRVEPGTLPSLVGRKTHRLLVSTIPARILCISPETHTFSSAEIYAVGDAPDLHQYCPVNVGHNVVVCNGEKSPGWYRASNVQGWKTAEWPSHSRPPVNGLARVLKPTATNCDCWGFRQEGIPSAMTTIGVKMLRAGRYGTWTKGVLSHEAYYWTSHELS